MTSTIVSVNIEPAMLKAYSKNEAMLHINVASKSDQILWCESEISVNSPLSLSFDSELAKGKIRIGIVEPHHAISKKVNIYTRPNNFPDEYEINLLLFIYDRDGAIFERIEQKVPVICQESQAAEQEQQNAKQ
ncbi:MAG: hypothetical protein M1331_03060 [Candidatus Marsarchaeota archaeon]|nr:hypothetical protein [Candidatus Marsarchaeota archaeon]MCL5106345.1 hypothetical protein [Candidatus Marsarchaeota archaeon]